MLSCVALFESHSTPKNHSSLFQFNFLSLFFLTLLPVGTPDLVDPVCVSGPAQCWVWLVDLERTVALLVGRCLGGMLQGAPPSPEEQHTTHWLKTPLFSNGLETDIPQLGMHIHCNSYN